MTQVTKTEMMQLIVSGKRHEQFENSLCGKFDITLMRRLYPAKGELCIVPTINLVAYIQSGAVMVDPERVRNLPESSWRDDPPLAVYYRNDDTYLLIDGHHRVMRRRAEGLDECRIIVFQEADIIRPAAGWGDDPVYQRKS